MGLIHRRRGQGGGMRRVVAGLAVTVLLAGCSTPGQRPPAAEPAAAPTTDRPPAGRVMHVGDQAEGIVADATTHVVAVATRNPYELVLLDANSGDVVHRTPLPGQLRHLQLKAQGGPVLVPDEGAGRLIEVALPGGDVTASVPVGTFPHDATAAANGTVFVSNEHGHSVVAVRGGKVVQTFTMPEQPGGIETIGNTVAMVDVRDATLTAYDADKLTQLGSVPAGNGPTHIVADNEGRFVVVDTRGNALLAFRDLKPVGSLPLPGTPYGAAFDRARDRMWVTLTGANEVVGVDLAGAQLTIAARFPTVRQPNTVAVDSGTGRVFVAGAADGVVEIIDP